MNDPAGFDPQAVLSVYGSRPTCVVTCNRHADMHHILGRGQAFGAQKKDPLRAAFGSIYNGVPLSPEPHHGPVRDAVEMRWLFLRIASQRVEQARIYEGYVVNDRDMAFLEIAGKWKKEHPVA